MQHHPNHVSSFYTCMNVVLSVFLFHHFPNAVSVSVIALRYGFQGFQPGIAAVENGLFLFQFRAKSRRLAADGGDAVVEAA